MPCPVRPTTEDSGIDAASITPQLQGQLAQLLNLKAHQRHGSLLDMVLSGTGAA